MSGSEQKAVLFMLKLEIRLNAEKISASGKYTSEVLYGMLIRAFQKGQMDYSEKSDETLLFVGRGCSKDYAWFGKLITALRNQSWFMEYVERWTFGKCECCNLLSI